MKKRTFGSNEMNKARKTKKQRNIYEHDDDPE